MLVQTITYRCSHPAAGTHETVLHVAHVFWYVAVSLRSKVAHTIPGLRQAFVYTSGIPVYLAQEISPHVYLARKDGTF